MKRLLVVMSVLLVAFAVTLTAQSFTVYTTLEELAAKELFDRYEQVTGIRVDWVRLSGGEAEARMEAERLNPQASIWVGGVGLNHISAKLKGLTTPYFSRAAANTPDQFKDPEGYWLGLYLGPLAFVTNVDRARELGIQPPAGWFEILDSKYAGLVRVANPNTSGTAYNLITCMISLFGGDEDLAFLYLKKLDRSIDMYTRSGSAGGKSVAIGEIPIAIGYAHDMVKLKAEGANIVINVPEEGTGFEIASMSLIKDGPDPVNAKKLYDWILTEEAQAIIASWYVIPVSKIAPKHPLSFSMEEIRTVHQDYVWDADNKERLLDRWTSEIGSGL
jgi:iron(III) transport system substrate-binding protein